MYIIYTYTPFFCLAITTNFSIQLNTKLVATENDNLTITCDLVHNGEVYQVSIEKLDAEVGSSNIIATCQMLEDGVELSEFNSRGQLNCSEALEVSLHLTNIVKEDGGLYRCNFSTDAGVQSTTILLTTLPVQGRTVVELAVYLQQRRPNCSLQGPKIIMHGILSAAISPPCDLTWWAISKVITDQLWPADPGLDISDSHARLSTFPQIIWGVN